VDDYLGPFFVTVVTIGRWVVFCFLAGYIQKLFKLTRPKASKQQGFRPALRTAAVMKGDARCNCV